MREIKFRAWDTAKDKWIYVSLGDLVCGATSKPSVALGDEFEVADGDKSTHGEFVAWGQYTGLKDKNGKEIYEGDIIAFWNTARGVTYRTAIRNKVVEWLTRRTFTGFSISENTDQTWEVIGNIYENPELITNP